MAMHVGMLWFDNNPKMDLMGKIAQARAYYQNKFKQPANLVFVHPSMTTPVSDTPVTQEFLEYDLRTSRSVMPNHFWVGVDDELFKLTAPAPEPVVEQPKKPAHVKVSEWDTLDY